MVEVLEDNKDEIVEELCELPWLKQEKVEEETVEDLIEAIIDEAEAEEAAEAEAEEAAEAE